MQYLPQSKGEKNTEVLNEFIGDIDLDLCVHELQSNVSLSEKQNISALNIGCVNHDHTNNFILNKIITTEVSASVNGFINKESCEVPDSELIPAFSKEETINKENCKEIIESTNLLSNSMKDVFNTEKYNKMNESIELFSASEEENISEVNQVRKKENVEPISTFQENIELISTFQEKNFSSPTFDNRDVSKNESFIKSSICSNFNSFSFSGEDSILVEEDKVNELVADNLSDICKNHSPTKTMSYINKEIAEEGGNTVVVDEDVLKFFEDDFVIEDHLIANNDKLNDDDKSDVSEDEHNNRHYNFKFQMSFYTNKVYLYDDKEKFIQLKFNFQNISMGIIDDLHQILLLDHHFNQLKRFTKEWISLGPRKQLLVTKKGVIFSSPLDAYAALYNINNSKLKSFKRFTEKKNISKIEKTAGNAGGKVIAVKRFSSGINKKSIVKEKKSIVNKKNPIVNEKNSIVKEKNPFVNENNLPAKESYKVDCGVLQAVDKQGIALCLYCEKQVEQIAAGSWLAQFCSHTCMQEFKIRSKSKHENAREQLFAVELGVCQMCGIDAHTVFLEISNMPIANRKAALEKTCFVKLSVPVLNKMIKHPKEGLFWQADHVLAVAEGGGECGLENYRTLCTPCHKVVTKDLMIRIKKVKPSHKETRSNGRLHRPQGSNFRKALVEQTKQRSKLASVEESSSRENSKLEFEKKRLLWPTHIDKLILDGQKHSSKRTCQPKNLEKTDQDQQALHEEQDNTVQSKKLIQNRKSTPCRQILSSQEHTTNKYEKVLQTWKIEKPVQSRSLLCEEQKSTVYSVKSIQENFIQSTQIDKCQAENEYSQLKPAINSTIKPAINLTTKPVINSTTSKSKLLEDAKIVMHSKRKMSESYKAAPIISNEQRRYTQPALDFKTSSIRKKSLSEQGNQPIIEKSVTNNKVESDEPPNNTAQRRLSKTDLVKRERKISLQEPQSIKNQVLNLEPEKFSQLFSYAQRRISDASPQMPGYPICDPQKSLLCESKIIEEQPSSLTESEFQKQAVMTLCEYCNYCILTKLEYHAGFHTCVWSGIICIATGFLCGFIPFCINECKDVVHKCPNCNKVLGTYRRL